MGCLECLQSRHESGCSGSRRRIRLEYHRRPTAGTTPMIAAPRELSNDQRILVQFARKLPWVALSSIVVFGGVVMLGGYWVRKTADTAAAHKAYHRAKVEFGLGRTALTDVCNASRRCRICQCRIPPVEAPPPFRSY